MPTIPEAMEIGWRCLQQGDWAQAEDIYRQVLAANPGVAQAWYLLGAVQQVRGQLDESVACYDQALRLVPDFAEVHNNLALVLHRQDKRETAVDHLRRAIQVKPDYAEAHNNLGNALHEAGQLDEAAACFRRAVELDPNYAEAHNNLGNALRSARRFDEAVASYDAALVLEPDHAQIHLSRAMAWLEMGDFERGWPEYEWRLKCPEYAIRSFRQPIWDGTPLDGRTILLYADHGLGDALQFIRYAPLVHARGGRVLVASRRPTARLLASCRGVAQVLVEGEDLPDFDVYAPLMSLPRIFQTTLMCVPALVPYLTPDGDLFARWSRELATLPGFRIGIAWQGNPEYRRDRHRSFPLSRFAPLAQRPGVRLFSLQKGFGSEQKGAIAGRFPLIDLTGQLADFMDDAAFVKNLDLVITPDTSLAHLAGSLGVPVWVPMPVVPDWRWLRDRDDSPWYPTMHLFRQKTWGDWDDVFARIAENLDARLASVGTGSRSSAAGMAPVDDAGPAA
jgi:Tfp pilus assembly protein PilF